MKRIKHSLVAAVVLLAATQAGAADLKASKRAAILNDVARCRALTDGAARLDCYDKAVAALDEAEKKGDVVVVDRAQVHEAKRQTFGLNINLGPIFDRGGKPETVDKLNTTVASASQSADGKWVITTAEGQVWRQIDNESLVNDPRKGDTVVIKHGTLGSFFMDIAHESAIRVHRDQ
jgi:hypothetical protein